MSRRQRHAAQPATTRSPIARTSRAPASLTRGISRPQSRRRGDLASGARAGPALDVPSAHRLSMAAARGYYPTVSYLRARAAWLGGVVAWLVACVPRTPCPEGFTRTAENPAACTSADDVEPDTDDADPTRSLLRDLSARCRDADGAACAQLGRAYLRGTLISRDVGRAARLLREACDRGDGQACEEVAEVYANEPAVADSQKAFAALKDACKLGRRSPCRRISVAPDDEPPVYIPPSAPATTPESVLFGSGTCFAVSPDGLVATADHVIDGQDAIAVQFGGEELLPATVESRMSTNDLALIRVQRSTQDYVRVSATPRVALGDKVFTVGFPVPDALGWEPKFTEGTISSLSVRGQSDRMQVSVPVHHGNSGGPLLSESGVLYGIIVAKQTALPDEAPDSIGYAVKASLLATLLDVRDVHKTPRAAPRKRAIQAATAATCLVLTAKRAGARTP